MGGEPAESRGAEAPPGSSETPAVGPEWEQRAAHLLRARGGDSAQSGARVLALPTAGRRGCLPISPRDRQRGLRVAVCPVDKHTPGHQWRLGRTRACPSQACATVAETEEDRVRDAAGGLRASVQNTPAGLDFSKLT